MRQCAERTNRCARTYPRTTEIPHGNCRWQGPFWSTSRGPFAWPLSILTSRAALTRPSSSHGSTNSRAKGKGPPHDPLPPREHLLRCSMDCPILRGPADEHDSSSLARLIAGLQDRKQPPGQCEPAQVVDREV